VQTAVCSLEGKKKNLAIKDPESSDFPACTAIFGIIFLEKEPRLVFYLNEKNHLDDTAYRNPFNYTEQNYKMQHFCLSQFFMTFFLQKANSSQILITNLSKSVLVRTSAVIHPSQKVWHIKMLIREQDYCTVCLRLATIKGHSKMCCTA